MAKPKVSLKDLNRGDLIAGGCVGIVLGAAIALLGSWEQGVGVGLFLWIMCAVERHRLVSKLKARAETDSGMTWDVQVNGVKVGTVSDAEYALIRLDVVQDWRNYAAQLANTGRVMLRYIDWLFVGVPVGVFWLALGVAIFSPETWAELLKELPAASPSELASAAVTGAKLLVLAGIFGAVLNAVFFGARFGFVNRFSEATAVKLRRRLDVAAEGNVVLTRWKDGALVFERSR